MVLAKRGAAVLWLIAAFTALRLLVAPFFDLGVDEAHYVLYARYLDYSYFDHPPLVGWAHALFYYTLGTNSFLARLPAAIVMALISWQVYRWLESCGYDQKASLWGVAALNGSFIFGALGLMLLPDTLLIATMFGVVFSVQRTVQKPIPSSYALLGVALGVAGLAKYTAFLLLPAVLIFLFWTKRTRLLFTPKLLLTAAIALLVVSPVLLWNFSHDWASFAYQGDHVANQNAWSLGVFARSLAAQFGAYSPPLFILALWGFYKAAKNPKLRLATSIGAVLLLFFFYTQGVKPALPHWISPFFALFIPLGTALLAQNHALWAKRTLHICVGLTLLVWAVVHAELALKLGRFEDFNSPFRDIYGWKEATEKAALLLPKLDSKKKALAVTNWSTASRVRYYAPQGVEIFLIDSRKDQFDLWENRQPTGYDLIFINSRFYGEDIKAKYICDSVESIGWYEAKLNGGTVDSFEFVACRNFQGQK